jgi:hypothetical protein
MAGLELMAEDRNARERHKRNIALAVALVGLVFLFYFMTMIRVHW